MKRLRFFSFVLVSLAMSFSLVNCKKDKSKTEPIVAIETDLGVIKVKLYNETPLHRDNFIKLIDSGFYDGISFHRIIKNFMIQAGDPKTKQNYKPERDDLNYTIDAELIKKFFHKKGVIAAARLGDNQNPLKKSSSSQFYIVQGKIFDDKDLEKVRLRKEEMIKSSITNRIILEKAEKLMDSGIDPDFTNLFAKYQDTINLVISKSLPYVFSDEQITTYKTIGGTPHLDGDYTVFGEVIEGLDVVDAIASVKTNDKDKPENDIKIKIKLIKR